MEEFSMFGAIFEGHNDKFFAHFRHFAAVKTEVKTHKRRLVNGDDTHPKKFKIQLNICRFTRCGYNYLENLALILELDRNI